jgi:anti-sigma factor RsiW
MLSEEMLWKYVEGELAPVQAGEIEELERTDEVVRRRLADIRTIRQEWLADAPQPPDGFPDRVALLATRLPKAPVIHLDEVRRFLRKALVAAAILAAVGLAYLAFEVAPDWLEPAPMQASPLLGE